MFNLLIKLSISFYGDLKSLPLAATSATIGRYAAGGVTNAPLHGSFYGRNKVYKSNVHLQLYLWKIHSEYIYGLCKDQMNYSCIKV